MIDTVRARVCWPRRRNISNDWVKITRSTEIEVAWEDEEQEIELSHTIKHKTLGIRAFATGRRFHTVEFSLPRLIHGDNGFLIRSQEEIEAALSNMLLAFEEVAITFNDIIDYRRIDLGLNFPCNPASVISAHHNCQYPRTSKKGARREFSVSSASWNYTGRRFVFYDKGRERVAAFSGRESTSELLRVEVQLQKDPLKRLLGTGGISFPTELNFQQCYQTFRSELIKFAPPRDIAHPNSKVEALAIMDQQYQPIGGLLPSELFTQHMAASTRRKWRRDVAQAHVEMVGFNWEDLLPECGPPPMHDCE